ncbi:LLM class flavin-dependent oxidoreductase [Williamsia phyllosphaerae]|uniref:Luciferase n=1 Tax=Williamsia phyllosphaerae TaxID=885042 RepID=A0ABQ1UUS6_9NOCA|nr:LLM class flavin-dependent oxidoreductase [Williamsia phyllosphaerae]GGF26673.1 luciferase [Williamsia phyllosphaerae]
MRHGIAILPEYRWNDARPLWERAEELGFDHAWTYDHVVWGGLPESEWFGAIPTLTAAATVTSRIALGIFVASPNFRHPAPFARELQTVADVSGDRLLVGLGAGGDPDSTIQGGEALSARHRVDRLQEFTELLDRVLSTDHVTSEGRWFSTTDMRLRGTPIRPRNPLLLAGNGPRSVGYAARTGDGWITTGPRADDLDTWFEAVAVSSAKIDESLDQAGRARADFPTYLSLDSSPVASLSSVSLYDDMTGRAAELGFSDVICHWPRETEPYRATIEVLEDVADRFLLPRAVDSSDT